LRDRRAWVLGYWSTSNRLNAKIDHVGARSSTETILAAVRDVCQIGVAVSLPDATAQTYDRFERDGK
jgi:hypothetical protein